MQSIESTVRRLARKRFNEIYDGNEHASFAACEALKWAASKAGFVHCGVEGICDEVGTNGVSYLNTGDTYNTTVLATTGRYSVRFWIGCYADAVERNPRYR